MAYTTAGTIRWIGARPNARWVLDQIPIDDHNARAISLAREGCPMLLTGPPGTGKTTISAAAYLAARSSGIECAWTTAAEYLADLREGWLYAKRFDDWGPKFSAEGIAGRVSVLYLDDLGAERETDFAVAELGQLISLRHARGLHTWATSNLDLVQLESTFGSRIVSRLLEGGRLIAVGGPDRRLARAMAS